MKINWAHTENRSLPFLAQAPVSRGVARVGFTLIEMLVVIAIIGVLAALLINILPAVGETKVRKLVKAELEALVTAIVSYKEKKGFYPPDNANSPGSNSLFYELVGTMKDPPPADIFRTFAGAPLNTVTINAYFGASGFINASTDPTEPAANYYKNLKPRQYATNGAGVVFLLVPYKGAANPNVWNYRLAGSNPGKPIHNPDKYDLWAEVLIGKKKVTIGNWND